jgi:hypothetical protein
MLTKFRMVLLIGFIVLIILISKVSISKADSLGQIPTVAVPTVTGTPSGAVATVTMEQDQINVRGGPSTEYPVVGVLIAGQQVPALGRSVGGDWVQIAYPGVAGGIAWVYSPLVIVSGSLPIVEPPPTPTPRTTPTVDPTLAAQFIVEIPPTRLPTFTAPPPLILPTFVPEQAVTPAERVPMGLLIVGMGIIGIFGVMISLLRGR